MNARLASGQLAAASTWRTFSRPPVRRIDQAYGDRNLACACPPPEAFAG